VKPGEQSQYWDDNFVKIKGGDFIFGCSDSSTDCFDDEKPKLLVHVKDFELMSTEVTYETWYKIYPAESKINDGNPEKCLNCPVSGVSWEKVIVFIKSLNGELTYLNDTLEYRLPTEVEWEYAAKGGRLTQGKKFAGSNDIEEVSWYAGNTSKIQQVKSKKPNELGIYDMSGNVMEWCSNSFWSYSKGVSTMTNGNNASRCVLRGGGCGSNATYCRVTCRVADSPASSHFDYGFRLVRAKK
jgi:formylglycine-generating enzyme required for sulfatase activity